MTLLPIRRQVVVLYASAAGMLIAAIPMITAIGASERAIPVAAPFRLDPVALALALVALLIGDVCCGGLPSRHQPLVPAAQP